MEIKMKYGCPSTDWRKIPEFKKEEMKEKLEEYAEKRANEVFDIDIYELEDCVKSGAKWMLEQLKNDPNMISRELVTRYLNELKMV